MNRRVLAAALLAAASFAAHAQTTPLAPGGSLQVSIPGASFSNDIYVDVPDGAERLTITLDAANTQQDVDLLVRYGSAFPTVGDADFLFDHAQYLSAGAQGSESLTLTRAGAQPLRAGRLYLSVINFANAAAPSTLRATLGSASDFVPIEVVFDDPGTAQDPCGITQWNDTTARQPVRGNNGTTLGQQRRNAMLEAARLLSEELRPSVAVILRACWSDLGGSSSGSTTLAQAGPEDFQIGDRGANARRPFLASQFTFYSQAATAHQAGTRSCNFSGGVCSQRAPDITATFNSTVDGNSQESRRFDYGFTAATSGTSGSSFISTAMHEITHGLGFAGLVSMGTGTLPLGARLTEFDDIYGQNAAQVAITASTPTTRPFLRLTDAERAAALTAGLELRFLGPNATRSPLNPLISFAPPLDSIALHAPNAVQPGSTYSHFAQADTGLFGQLMLPNIPSTAPRTLGLARDVLKDLGWVSATRNAPTYPTPPNTQYYDVAHNGHGIDFRRVAGTTDLYFLGVYSYDAAGNPEWYTALGRIVDGLFVPARNEFGDSLVRSLFRAGQTPQSVPESSAAFEGEVKIDFVQAATSPACYNAVPGRNFTGTLAVMSFVLDGEFRQWCMQPLLGENPNVDTDLGSVWFNPSDPGWGITVLSLPGVAGDGVAIGVYYPDATGKGRWGIVQAGRYVPGETLPVMQVRGYPRDGTPPAAIETTQIGTLRLNIGAPGSGQPNTLSLDVTYPGPEGGRFVRTDAPLTPANEPGY